jgi:hypothetical protein
VNKVNMDLREIGFGERGMNLCCSGYNYRVGLITILFGSPVGKKSLERPRSRWVIKVNMELREIGFWERGMNLCCPGYGPVAGSCEHGDKHRGSIKCGEFNG